MSARSATAAFTVLALAALLAAGCLGYPEGAARRPGDTVSIRYTATDLDTGEILAEGVNATVVLGTGSSGLGFDVERALLGHAPGDTFALESRDDPGRGYGQEVRTNATLDYGSRTQEVERGMFEQQFGPARVGDVHAIQEPYNLTVTAANETHVAIRINSPEGYRQEAPELGVTAVYNPGGDNVTISLEPMVGAEFTIRPSPYGTPLDLAPGRYRTLGVEEGKVVYAHHPDPDGTLLERDVRFEVTVLEVEPTQVGVAEGSYGARLSPYATRMPAGLAPATAPTAPDPGHAAGDGHDHAP